MNRYNFQQNNAFVSREEEMMGLDRSSSKEGLVVCPKPRRVANLIRPLRLHMRYTKSILLSQILLCLGPNTYLKTLFFGLEL